MFCLGGVLGKLKSIFSVDAEDWFHIIGSPATPEISQWDSLPSILDKNVRILLDTFSNHSVSVTFFFLGWVAKKYPYLVREVVERGHEVASHGYGHELVSSMGSQEFFDDISKTKKIIEDICGQEVLGYRAPGFSVIEETEFFFHRLAEAGYTYDSSVFPASHGHGGIKQEQRAPYIVKTDFGDIIEFPISVYKIIRPVCFFGGGYLRIFPYWIIKKMANAVLRENRPVIYYVHPREIDSDAPRLSMNMKRRFKSYVNLKTTGGKIKRILDDFDVETFKSFISSMNSEYYE